jgi:hypothetical protein
MLGVLLILAFGQSVAGKWNGRIYLLFPCFALNTLFVLELR